MADNPRFERAFYHALKCLQEIDPQQIIDQRAARNRAVEHVRDVQVLLRGAKLEAAKGIPQVLIADLEYYGGYLQEWAADLERAVKEGEAYDFREACAELAQVVREMGERLDEHAHALKVRREGA